MHTISIRNWTIALTAAALFAPVGPTGSSLLRAETSEASPPAAPRSAPDSDRDYSASGDRSGYSYVRLVTGDATVNSKWNGRVDARRNMPISAGDEILVSDAARVEIGLADGNVLQIGGGTRAQFESMYAQQGEDDEYSAIGLRDGSLILAALGRNEDRIPRIDTDDATVYVSPGGRVRVNFDPHRGTTVVVRNGSVDVKMRAGSYKLKGGQYLIAHGEEEPEIARGSFSRDRFDLWAAERSDAIAESPRTVSARYVDEDYASDVESLDGYGDWNYSPTYSSYVWTPHVDINWMPFSVGSWYYTPAGLTWWSSDPWGWYPHHYGNWYFEASWNRWCWSPAAVYSPAWVYWAYSGNYVGWCPTGWYSGYGPWWNTYYQHDRGNMHPGGDLHNRGNVYVALHGTFRPREVDFRGWNFTGANRIGSGYGRTEVVRGDRIAGQLGTQVAITSRPFVVPARPGEAREAIRDYLREAPRTIERASATESSRLAPILAREKTLPADTVTALRDRTVVAERGRLAGAAAAELAPRGARIERGRAQEAAASTGSGTGSVSAGAIERTERPGFSTRAPERGRAEAASPAGSDWRSRGRTVEPPAAPARATERVERARPETPATAPSEGETRGRVQDWRTREIPPARRVIDGAVPGRRAIERRTPEGRPQPEGRAQEARAQEPQPQQPPPARTEYAAPPRHEYRHPEVAQPPRVESAPAPRAESRPAPAPPPRAESRQAPPPPQPSDRVKKD